MHPDLARRGYFWRRRGELKRGPYEAGTGGAVAPYATSNPSVSLSGFEGVDTCARF